MEELILTDHDHIAEWFIDLSGGKMIRESTQSLSAVRWHLESKRFSNSFSKIIAVNPAGDVWAYLLGNTKQDRLIALVMNGSTTLRCNGLTRTLNDISFPDLIHDPLARASLDQYIDAFYEQAFEQSTHSRIDPPALKLITQLDEVIDALYATGSNLAKDDIDRLAEISESLKQATEASSETVEKSTVDQVFTLLHRIFELLEGTRVGKVVVVGVVTLLLPVSGFSAVAAMALQHAVMDSPEAFRKALGRYAGSKGGKPEADE